MPTRCPQSHDPRVGGLANRTSTTAADRYQWTLVPATNAPSRPHAPNAMRGRLNPTTRVARAHRNAAGQHLDPALQPSLTPTSITISACAREPRATPQSHDSRVGGHVDDPSPTAVHIRCYRATSTRSRLRTMSIFVFVPSDRASRARGPNPTALEWTGAHRTSTIRARRSSTSSSPHLRIEAGCSLFFYFACTRETRATPQSHDDNDNGDDNFNENDNLCATVHREVKPPQKRLAPAQTIFHAPFRPRARRNPTTPAWAGTHRTPTTFEWPRWRQAVFRRSRVRRGSLPARTCIPVLWSRNPTEDVPVGYTYDVRGGWPLTVVDAFHRGCLPPRS